MMKTVLMTAILGAALAAAAGAAPPVTLTLAASTATVTYGSPVTLSGQLSTQKANQAIGLAATECGSTKQTKAATVKTIANGAYSSSVTPTIGTAYQATYKNVKSASISIAVRPLLELAKTSGGHYTAKATAGQALTGKFVLFQRYKKLRKRWVQVKRLPLGAAVPGATKPAMVSSVSFTSTLPRGTRVRMLITAKQAGPCYAAASSKSLRA
jgi:hypothetical protein